MLDPIVTASYWLCFALHCFALLCLESGETADGLCFYSLSAHSHVFACPKKSAVNAPRAGGSGHQMYRSLKLPTLTSFCIQESS